MTTTGALLTSPSKASEPAAGELETLAGHDDLSSLCRWVGDQVGSAHVALVCAHETGSVRTGADVLAVRLDGCAFELSPASYLELVGAGAASVVVLSSRCPRKSEVGAAIAAANHLLSACGSAVLVSQRSEEDRRQRRANAHGLRALPFSRRRLLFLRQLDRAWVPEVHLDHRSRVVAALRRLCSEASVDGILQGLPAPSAVLAATDCNACGVCVRACPTGAINLQEEDADSSLLRLEYAPARCDDCGRCVALCPTGALVRTAQADWASLLAEKPQILATVPVRRCVRCAASFTGVEAGGYCPPCAFRLANPFGSTTPGLHRSAIGLDSAGLVHAGERVRTTG